MDLASFKQKFTGDVVTPSSPDYDSAIARWASNAVRPAAVVAFVRSPQDAGLALSYARSNALNISIKGGGHSPAGASSVDGGLVIDLSRYLNGVRVDEEQKRAYVQGGAVWETVDRETIRYGLATVGGTVNHTGVGGLITGGGYGWLSGEHGLAIDNLLEATVVIADGQILTASETCHPDLFWGIRGGGSNFGIVTEFVLRLHPQRPTVFAGALMYTRDHVPAVAKNLELWIANAHGKEGIHCVIARAPNGQPCLVLQIFFNGSEAKGRENFKVFYDLKPFMDICKELPYDQLNGIMNHTSMPGRPCWMRGGLRAPVGEALTLELFDHFVSLSSGKYEVAIILEFISHKKINSVEQNTTPYRRDMPGNALVVVHWEDEKSLEGKPKIWSEGAPDAVKKIADDLVARVKVEGRAYSNYDPDSEALPNEGSVKSQRVQELFRDNYQRLQQVKAKYDPEVVFNKWFVIAPAIA